MAVTHKAKTGALLSGTEYEAADAHNVSLTAADVGAEAAGAVATHAAAGDPHTGYRLESADHSHASTGAQAGKLAQANTHESPDTDAAAGSLHHTVGSSATQAAAGNHSHTGNAPDSVDYLVGTASGGLSAEIAVGTSPGGELGGTWASPTVDTTHSGSTHAATTAAAIGAYDIERRIAGDLTVTSSSAGAAFPTIGTLTVAAATGDLLLIGLAVNILSDSAAATRNDVGTIVSGAVVNYVSSLNGTPLTTGIAPWNVAISGTLKIDGCVPYVVQAGDISGGNVELGLRSWLSTGSDSRTYEAGAGAALVFWVKNLKQ